MYNDHRNFSCCWDYHFFWQLNYYCNYVIDVNIEIFDWKFIHDAPCSCQARTFDVFGWVHRSRGRVPRYLILIVACVNAASRSSKRLCKRKILILLRRDPSRLISWLVSISTLGQRFPGARSLPLAKTIVSPLCVSAMGLPCTHMEVCF